jgi:hypothetical protein
MIRAVFAAAIVLALGAGLPPMLSPPALAQGSEADQIAHWDRVKASRDPADIRSYLDKYPNGMFVALARIRLRNLEGGSNAPAAGSPPPSAPPAAAVRPPPSPPAASSTPSTATPPQYSSTASALTSPSIIREVQVRLYNLNYQIKNRDGRLTANTRDEIRKWQTNIKQPVTGDVSEYQLSLLRRAVLPTTWGAIAYYSKGATATVWNRGTREEAERDALADCRKRAGAQCNILTVANNICAALGFYNAVISGKQYWGAYASVRPTLGQATDNAMSECQRQARNPNGCGIRTTVCADGSHRR